MPPPDPKTQTSEELVAFLNSRLDVQKTNPAVHFLRGKIVSYDEKTGVITMRYTTHDQLSNGANMVQGGFTAAMLDAAFAFLVSDALQ